MKIDFALFSYFGINFLVHLSLRSSARLAMGDNVGALEDARESSLLAPKYPQVTYFVF